MLPIFSTCIIQSDAFVISNLWEFSLHSKNTITSYYSEFYYCTSIHQKKSLNDWLIVLGFYAVLTIFQPCDGGQKIRHIPRYSNIYTLLHVHTCKYIWFKRLENTYWAYQYTLTKYWICITIKILHIHIHITHTSWNIEYTLQKVRRKFYMPHNSIIM